MERRVVLLGLGTALVEGAGEVGTKVVGEEVGEANWSVGGTSSTLLIDGEGTTVFPMVALEVLDVKTSNQTKKAAKISSTT